MQKRAGKGKWKYNCGLVFFVFAFFFNQINIFRKTAPAMELKQNDDSYKSVWNAQAEGKCLRDAYSNV